MQEGAASFWFSKDLCITEKKGKLIKWEGGGVGLFMQWGTTKKKNIESVNFFFNDINARRCCIKKMQHLLWKRRKRLGLRWRYLWIRYLKEWRLYVAGKSLGIKELINGFVRFIFNFIAKGRWILNDARKWGFRGGFLNISGVFNLL